MPRAIKKTQKKTAPGGILREIIMDTDNDERRLLYVALTRAKESVTLTYAKEGDDHRENLPSEFLTEIMSEQAEKIDTDVWEKAFTNDVEFKFTTPHKSPGLLEHASIHDVTFVRELFSAQGLSPTALNNYLECPWKYFYQNLIRIPSAPSKHQSYGIAVHGALADFFNHIKEEEVGKEYLLASFERWMNIASFNPRDFTETKERGTKALSGWYDTYHALWNIRTQTEYKIKGVLLTDTIRLTGVLDKIERADDDTVTVVDYKTAKPKSRNELMGLTKNADGNYYRQLIFYKLLLKYYKEGEYRMRYGVIDFIEPDDKGIYHREVFEITDDEVVQLEKRIREIADEILTLKFWDSRCGEKDCEFCALRNMMR